MLSKKMKLITVIMSLFLLLTACSPATLNQEPSGTEPPTEAQQNDPAPFAFESLKLAGNDISQYTIVYRRHSYYKVYNQIGDLIVNDYDFDRLTAERLSDLIYQKFGVQLPVKQDTKFDKTEYEILVGETNRDLHPTNLTEDQYVFKMSGKKLVVCGGIFGTTWHAVDSFEAWLVEKATAQNASPDFTESDNVSSAYEMKAIACIGDSITYGSTSTNPEYLSYPANLQRMLWKDYIVFNYGHGGKTMRDDLADSYMSSCTCHYPQCLANPIGYDLVLIMLGTNDSSRDQSWTAGDNQRFKTSCKTLIDSVKEKNPDATFVLMNCPAYYGNGTAGSEAVRNVQLAVAKELYAADYDIHFYDMHTYTSQEMGEALFPDKLHPADEGYVKMADGVKNLVLAVMEGQENKYLVSLKTADGGDDSTNENDQPGGTVVGSNATTFHFANNDRNTLGYENPDAATEAAGNWETVIDVSFDDTVNVADQRMTLTYTMADGSTFQIMFQRRFDNHRVRLQLRKDGSDTYYMLNSDKNAGVISASGSKDVWSNGLADANTIAASTEFRITAKYDEINGFALILSDRDGSAFFTLTDPNGVLNMGKETLSTITVLPDISCDNGSTKNNTWDISFRWLVNGVEDQKLYDSANWLLGSGWTTVTANA